MTRNPEIRNNPVLVLPNIWRLGQVMETKFDTYVSNKILLNAAKLQGNSSYPFWVIKGKPTGGRVKLPPPPPRPRLGLIKRYDEVRKISIGQGDDYTTGCLLDFSYFKNNYRLIAADLTKKSIRCRFKSNLTNHFYW